MIEQDRIVSAGTQGDEAAFDRAVRPKKLADYVGQTAVKTQMEIFIQAARNRREALDHRVSARPRSRTSSRTNSA
jgi:Holliday junction DNA helicase RuvB